MPQTSVFLPYLDRIRNLLSEGHTITNVYVLLKLNDSGHKQSNFYLWYWRNRKLFEKQNVVQSTTSQIQPSVLEEKHPHDFSSSGYSHMSASAAMHNKEYEKDFFEFLHLLFQSGIKDYLHSGLLELDKDDTYFAIVNVWTGNTARKIFKKGSNVRSNQHHLSADQKSLFQKILLDFQIEHPHFNADDIVGINTKFLKSK